MTQKDPAKPDTGNPATLRDVAARLQVKHQSLSEAIAAGKMTDGVAVDARGRARIVDVDAFVKQWRELHALEDVALPDGVPQLAESKARREAALAALAEIELAERQSELVRAADVEARLVNVFSNCKTKLLGVPSRARQRDPTLTGPQIDLFESLIREALEDLGRPAEE
jgi:phage terminase Nu1 subunit (DNA packaging protein)